MSLPGLYVTLLCTFFMWFSVDIVTGICHSQDNNGHGESVRHCDFSRLFLRSVQDVDIPEDCHTLDFSHNLFSTVENFVFRNVTRLFSLDLSYNHIETLNSNSFLGLNFLECLSLEDNRLQPDNVSYPMEVFQPLTQLKTLYLRKNAYEERSAFYPDEAFKTLTSLKELSIDLLTGLTFGEGFAKLDQLKTLIGGSGNSADVYLNNDTFRVFKNLKITSLFLERCSLTDIDNMAFQHFPYLQRLSLRNNHVLGLIKAANTLDGLATAPLSRVDFCHVNSGQVSFPNRMITAKLFEKFRPFCLTYLDLSDNMVVHCDSASFRPLNAKCIKTIRFDNFYLTKQDLVYFFLQASRFQNLTHAHLSNIILEELPFSKQPDLPDKSKRSTAVETIWFPPHIESINMSRGYISCRSQKTVIFKGTSRAQTLDLSYSNLDSCFQKRIYGLESLQTLIISGNHYSDNFSPRVIKSFPNLKKLVARDTPLSKVFKSQPGLFASLTQLEHLDIGNSEIANLQPGVLSAIENLKKLDVSHNKLSKVPKDVFSLPNLEYLDLRFNALSYIPAEDRRQLDDIAFRKGNFAILLEGNPLACNCDTFDFVKWLWVSSITFDKNRNYSCLVKNGSTIPILHLKPDFHELTVKCISSFWLVFGTVGALIVLLSLLVSAAIYRHRVPIKYWCHTICRKPRASPKQTHKYDVLIAYCHQDYHWVCQILYPKLTDIQQPYQVCVYDRNFLPGVPIEENIITAINSSFKVILVISPAFVESTWCRFELQMARMKMIQEGREDVVIPVILEDIPVSSMPKSLLNLWNTSVFLVWSQSPGELRHFWENLMSALGPARVRETNLVRGTSELEIPLLV